jgi:hypothetical protein
VAATIVLALADSEVVVVASAAAVPVPLRVMACGELEALSAMESDAV